MGWGNPGRTTWGGGSRQSSGGKAQSRSSAPSISPAPSARSNFYFEQADEKASEELEESSPGDEGHGKRTLHHASTSPAVAGSRLLHLAAKGGKAGKGAAAKGEKATGNQLVVPTQRAAARPGSRTTSPSHYYDGTNAVTTAADEASDVTREEAVPSKPPPLDRASTAPAAAEPRELCLLGGKGGKRAAEKGAARGLPQQPADDEEGAAGGQPQQAADDGGEHGDAEPAEAARRRSPLGRASTAPGAVESRGLRLLRPGGGGGGKGGKGSSAKGAGTTGNQLVVPGQRTAGPGSRTTSPSHYYTTDSRSSDKAPSASSRSPSSSHYFDQVDEASPPEVSVVDVAKELQEIKAMQEELAQECARDDSETPLTLSGQSQRPTPPGPRRGLTRAAATPNKEPAREVRATTRGWRPSQPDLDDELADPDTIFTCCDTDESGLLDPHELKFALNAYGLFPDAKTVRDWMQGSEALTRSEFRDLLQDKSASAPQSMRQPRAIPYARRGVSFGQLDALHRVFVMSGWIEACCEKANKENEADIASGKVYKLEANLYALDKFVVRPLTSPDADARTSVPEDMRQAAYIPEATYKCSYSELVNPNGVRVDTFVSHFWGHPFEDTMQALEKWGQQAYKSFGRQRPEEIVFWLCFLALNQHRAAEEVGSSPEEGPFNAALAQARNAVMILDDSVNPFKRIWCLYEVQRLTDLSKDFELVCSCGPMGAFFDESSQHAMRHSDAVESMRRIGDALEQVSAYHAGASNPDDKHAIWHRVADPVVRQIPLAKILGQRRFRESDFKRFDMKIRSLLAGPLFRTSLSDRDSKAAVRYIGLGAAFTEQDVESLVELCDENVLEMEMPVRRGHDKPVMWKLLHAAAYFGHQGAIKGLLDRQADLEVQTRFGLTPLHLATSNDNSEVARALLAQKADVNALNKDKRSSLHGAAVQGHFGCVEVLLQHGADVTMADARGDSVLHAAVYGNNGDVVRVLLEYRANPRAETRRGGFTPLHCAARDNFVEAADALLRFGPPGLALARNLVGLVPWELAHKEGYTELAAVLCEAAPVDEGICP